MTLRAKRDSEARNDCSAAWLLVGRDRGAPFPQLFPSAIQGLPSATRTWLLLGSVCFD
jgi:hypothetical protein